MCELNGRGILQLDSVDDAATETRQALDHAHRLVDESAGVLGADRARRLSDAISGVAGAYEAEFGARLVAMARTVTGCDADVFVLPELEEEP